MMTEKQKEGIKALRWRGKTYKAIGEALDMPMDTVKSYCRRHSITVLNQNPSVYPCYVFCENCGEPILRVSKHKPKKFCTVRCRDNWWNKHRRLVSNSLIVAQCLSCGKEFKKYKNNKQRYCGKTCYINHRFGEVPEK